MSIVTTQITPYELKTKNILQRILIEIELSKHENKSKTELSNDELDILWNFAVQGWSRQVGRCEVESMKEIIAAQRRELAAQQDQTNF